MNNINNLLKVVFLLVSLVSSSASANNSSLPLSGTNLTLGQNNSELVKRDEPITLVGGTEFTGMYFRDKGEVIQRPCTLAFPVFNEKEQTKGFLTSGTCVNSNILVGDTVVGIATFPTIFDPERGLDYIFVRIFDSFWEDNISWNITYSQCGGDALIPLLPILHQPPLNFEVCAYVEKGAFTCGKIAEFNATIRVEVPGSLPGEQPVLFLGVVKVIMERDYFLEYLGAPVYIPLQVPNSKQMVASPVGMVVENFDRELDDDNIWYYTPLDKILESSRLKIDNVNLSYLLPPNNTESSNSTTSSNTSEVASNHLEKRQVQILFTHPGLQFLVSSNNGRLTANPKQCTLGFAIRRFGAHRIDHGFLTLGSCMFSDRMGGSDGAFYTRPRGAEMETINLGWVSGLQYSRLLGLNYALVRLRPNDNQRILWDNYISTSVPVPGGSADVFASATTPFVGFQVCAETGYSGQVCGTVANTAATLTSINPWEWSAWFRREILDLSAIESWQNLIKIRVIGGTPRALSEERKSYDFGSPVYLQIRSNAGVITRVQPVGILMDYVYEESEDGTSCEVYMYCVSLERILLNNPNLELNGTPH